MYTTFTVYRAVPYTMGQPMPPILKWSVKWGAACCGRHRVPVSTSLFSFLCVFCCYSLLLFPPTYPSFSTFYLLRRLVAADGITVITHHHCHRRCDLCFSACAVKPTQSLNRSVVGLPTDLLVLYSCLLLLYNFVPTSTV